MSHRPTPSAPSAPACTDSLGNFDHHASLMARAKADAARLRNEAIRDFGTHAFANFWRDANTVWQHMEASVGSAARSARRLQARLNRRQAPTHSA
ncbi:MAG: hypothetical protein K2W33_07720 [Burkholderiales bacterium]|nr:hypothetical protein [Burkholderiales bacterium]